MRKFKFFKFIVLFFPMLILIYGIQALFISEENYSKIRWDDDLLDTNESYIKNKGISVDKKTYINDFVFEVYKNIDYKKPINDIKNVFEDYFLEDNKLTLYYQGRESIVIELLRDGVYKVNKVTYTDEYGRIVQSEITKDGSLIYKISENGIENFKDVDSFDKQEEFLKNKPLTILF